MWDRASRKSFCWAFGRLPSLLRHYTRKLPNVTAPTENRGRSGAVCGDGDQSHALLWRQHAAQDLLLSCATTPAPPPARSRPTARCTRTSYATTSSASPRAATSPTTTCARPPSAVPPRAIGCVDESVVMEGSIRRDALLVTLLEMALERLGPDAVRARWPTTSASSTGAPSSTPSARAIHDRIGQDRHDLDRRSAHRARLCRARGERRVSRVRSSRTTAPSGRPRNITRCCVPSTADSSPACSRVSASSAPR